MSFHELKELCAINADEEFDWLMSRIGDDHVINYIMFRAGRCSKPLLYFCINRNNADGYLSDVIIYKLEHISKDHPLYGRQAMADYILSKDEISCTFEYIFFNLIGQNDYCELNENEFKEQLSMFIQLDYECHYMLKPEKKQIEISEVKLLK